jgi:hypothetical protein
MKNRDLRADRIQAFAPPKKRLRACEVLFFAGWRPLAAVWVAWCNMSESRNLHRILEGRILLIRRVGTQFGRFSAARH